MTLSDRIIGCIVAGAIGDAMGGPYEGRTGPIDYHPPDTWAISDDTQLTLATCEAISQACRVDPQDVAERFLAWFRERRITGIGASTLKALRDLDVGGHWALSGARGERAAGNGAAMRAAPLAFVLAPESERGRTTLRDICRITHHNDEAYIGALAIVITVRLVAIEDRQLDSDLPGLVADTLPDSQVRDRLIELKDAAKVESLAQCAARFGASAFVVDSVPLAIVAASSLQRSRFEKILKTVVECGGDTDTVASMTGQIVGAAVGLSALPHDLLESLPELPFVTETATAFARIVESL